MHWPEFAQRLGTALHRLAADPNLDTTLVVSQATQPLAYVQFLINDGGVYAEVSSAKKYLPKDQRLADESFTLLKQAGWHKPGSDNRNGNWMVELTAARPEGCAELGESCAAALRDVWRVPDPHTLVYRAFVGGTGENLAVDELGLAQEQSQ